MQNARFSAAAGLDKEQITTRVLDVLKGFEKVDQVKVCIVMTRHLCVVFNVSYQLATSSSFAEDLGLDSLDAVEVVMAVEEVCPCPFSLVCSWLSTSVGTQEFSIEIPDAEADEIKTVQQGASACLLALPHVSRNVTRH